MAMSNQTRCGWVGVGVWGVGCVGCGGGRWGWGININNKPGFVQMMAWYYGGLHHRLVTNGSKWVPIAPASIDLLAQPLFDSETFAVCFS